MGNTSIAKALEVSTEGLENFGYGDVFIKTVNGSVFIVSSNIYSIRGAAMEYLREELGAEVYAANCYSVDKKAEGANYVLQEQNLVVRYDMDIRTTDNSFLRGDDTYYEMGYMPRAETMFLVSASAHQTITYYVPYATYGADHPMWYSGYNEETNTNAFYGSTGKPAQVCFNANGNASELQLMKEAFLNTMINHRYGLKNPNYKAYVAIIGNEDNQDYCQCEACIADYMAYGVYNASALKFCNSLSEMVSAWMETEEGKQYKRDFEIWFLAYDLDAGAPARFNNDTAKWEPIDSSVLCKDNVFPFFAPSQMDFKRSIYSEVNAFTRDAFEGWKACSPNGISLYLYQSNWRDSFSHYDTISMMQEQYQFFATGNIKFIHNSGSAYPVGARFETLTAYLSSVLAKDVNADVAAATNTFFTNYFGAAATPMKAYFDEYMAWTKNLRDDGVYKNLGEDLKGTCYIYEILINEVKNGYLDYTKLAIWAGYVDEALAAIECLKTTDAEAYELLYKRIVAERLSIYFPFAYHAKALGDLTSAQVREQFMTDCELLGITSGGWLWPNLGNDLFIANGWKAAA